MTITPGLTVQLCWVLTTDPTLLRGEDGAGSLLLHVAGLTGVLGAGLLRHLLALGGDHLHADLPLLLPALLLHLRHALRLVNIATRHRGVDLGTAMLI